MQTQQKLFLLTAADERTLEQHRHWVKGHYLADHQYRYDSPEEILKLLDIILQYNWVLPGELQKLKCLGVSLGDALAKRLGLDWVVVDDEYGRDFALRDPQTGVLIFPVTMISKRVETGEEFSVFTLFNSTADSINQRRPDSEQMDRSSEEIPESTATDINPETTGDAGNIFKPETETALVRAPEKFVAPESDQGPKTTENESVLESNLETQQNGALDQGPQTNLSEPAESLGANPSPIPQEPKQPENQQPTGDPGFESLGDLRNNGN